MNTGHNFPFVPYPFARILKREVEDTLVKLSVPSKAEGCC